MPTYEYRCKSCGEHLEVVQSFADDPLTICPNCQGELRKVFSPIGIAFKGSGFYRTDSRVGSSSGGSSSTKTAEAASSSSNSNSNSSGSSSSDSSSAGSSSGNSSSTNGTEAKSA